MIYCQIEIRKTLQWAKIRNLFYTKIRYKMSAEWGPICSNLDVLKPLAVILTPLVTLPCFTRKLYCPSTSPFHSRKTTNFYIYCKYAKTAPKCHSDMTHCEGGLRFCEIKTVNKAHICRPTELSVHCSPGVGVTKVPFVNFSVSKIFDLAKVPVGFFKYHSYLTGVTAAELRRHLSNMNVVFNS